MDFSMFELAVRSKYRFVSKKGLLAIEDLYDLKLTDLDDIAKNVFHDLKQSQDVSFISNKTKGSKELELKLDILKYIIDIRMKEEDKKKTRNKNLETINQLKQIALRKQDEKLNNMEMDEILKEIKRLEEESGMTEVV